MRTSTALRCDVVVRQLPNLLDFRDVSALARWPGACTCHPGADPLSLGPVSLDRTELDIFVACLFAPERRIPFLLITPLAPDEWLVDPLQFVERLADMAKVW